ncbi:DUF5330 domain-containing protein [Oryzifoliimicrobium ureilyticus]|uniref:DUF5330 domain-containing protein n=1 Tax=Oryzifoliimicrobium ureilyticus TaxID=3113724 RepID=UPI0030760B1D
MWFLIKTCFFFGLVLLLLPFFVSAGPDGRAATPGVQLTDAVSTVSGLYSYASGMCGEKPELCVKGGTLLSALGAQAREGAFIAYRLLDEHFGSANQTQPALAPVARQVEVEAPTKLALEKLQLVSAGADNTLDRNAALGQAMPNFPKPYRPPVDDEISTATTSTIPLPMPRPVR